MENKHTRSLLIHILISHLGKVWVESPSRLVYYTPQSHHSFIISLTRICLLKLTGSYNFFKTQMRNFSSSSQLLAAG